MKYFVLGTFGLIVVTAVILVGMWLSYSNGEAKLRNLITAKQKDNQSQLDNTVKVISQTAQVTDAQVQSIKDIIVGNATARHVDGGNLMLSIQEAVPNVDRTTETFTNLQNIIVAARNTWTNNQRELLDYKREHDNLIDTQPSRFFVVTLGGKDKIDVVIVTSTRTEKSFETGKDDDDQVFRRPQSPNPATNVEKSN